MHKYMCHSVSHSHRKLMLQFLFVHPTAKKHLAEHLLIYYDYKLSWLQALVSLFFAIFDFINLIVSDARK